MTRSEYKSLVHELNEAYRYGNTLNHAAVHAMASLKRARKIVLEAGRPA